MSFIDEVTIEVEAGSGGHGCLSFRREKNVPMGGPDGGDGGRGGNVWFKATNHLNTLLKFKYQKQFKAPNGECGHGRQKAGSYGDDYIIEVPVGTQIKVVDTDFLLVDLQQVGQSFCVAQGGRGGLGNVHFKSSTRRAPRIATQGKPGEKLTLQLTLSLLSDVGLLGVPNAGKSSLIRQLSAATPRVADYPFTTTKPHLGVVDLMGSRQLVMADIPGLIAGAAEGSGMGVRFLKHLMRCRCLLQVVDAGQDVESMLAEKKMIERELAQYDASLMQKPRLIVINKCDLYAEEEVAERVKSFSKEVREQVVAISAVSGWGLDGLKKALMQVCYAENT